VRPSRLPFAAAALAAVALAAPTAAQAKLPSFSETSFVPNVSIGGARLGQSRTVAKHEWGSTRGTCSDFSCLFQDVRHSNLGIAEFDFEDGKRGRVSKLYVSVGRNTRGKSDFSGPLEALRGANGVGFGSSQRAVKAAYPKAKTVAGATTYLSLVDHKGNQTLFSFENHRLIALIIQDKRPRG
jgi:hypothetical protein